MKYKNIVEGKFAARPNRFIAHVEINGQTEICHVKNTGRCRELLIEGSRVFLEKSDNPHRKTKYDLISVYKGDMLVNMDSQVPNKAVGEWLASGGLFEDITVIKPEKTYGTSRFDFYVEAGNRRIFMEVKGVTLEHDGIARFPDAPTERGVKHLRELKACIGDGYEAYVVFVIQMKGTKLFMPNIETHKEFAEALKEAQEAGVGVLAYDCDVTEDSIKISSPVPVKLC
ncbi:MAG: DNA/RNA nuclease SfsA [Anaerovoracaceae bacterium]